jgi:hypothetical protein
MNPALPITDYRDRIIRAVSSNDVVVITAETGAGKSTQVPQYLLEAGYSVIATQPRRMAARTVAQRVAEEVGTPLGEVVGFRTAEERNDSKQTRVLFCTDGLQMVRELTGYGSPRQVLIIDEVHEWNRNIETLVAWSKYLLSLGQDFKVVLMSATVEAERLADYFGGAPIIEVPGRLFPVEELRSSDTMAKEISDLADQGRNVLAFVPGKADIEDLISELREGLVTSYAEVFALHGEMSAADQRLVFQHYDRPKVIVSTNVAQTSVTIDDIDAVVDSGTEKRIEVHDGVEGLYIGHISQADCQQRKGRAGRTKPGVYVLCSDTPLHKREEFPTAEILRSRLDQLVLRLAEIGLDATELDFFHQPSRETLVEAKEALKRLGALYEDGEVTEIGHAMSRLPVNVHHARMIVEAEKLGVTDEILTIVACLEAGGIRGKGKRKGRTLLLPRWRELTQEENSDLLAELDCFLAAGAMSNDEKREKDILVKNFYKAKEIRARLARDLGASLHPSTSSDRGQVIRASVAGMVDFLYRYVVYSGYTNGKEKRTRQLDMNSVVTGQADWVTAMPFDLQFERKVRPRTWELELDPSAKPSTVKEVRHLLVNVTRVDPEWLKEYVPEGVLSWIELHEPETVEVEGVQLSVTYETSQWSSEVSATIRINIKEVDKLAYLPQLPKASRIDKIELVDDEGTVLETSYSASLLDVKEKAAKTQAQAGFLSKVRELKEKEAELAAMGRPTSELQMLIIRVQREISSNRTAFTFGTEQGRKKRFGSSDRDVEEAIATARKEVERLQGNPAEVLLEDLLAGRILHPAIGANMAVVKELDSYAIRSGGFIETLSDEQLREFYQGKLDGVTSASQVRGMDLRLRLEDYAPKDVLAELELAPETVELEGKKGTSQYPVTYGYEEIDGERVAVGSIQIPISVYERNCAESGRKSKFPELPHGARLIIELTENNQPVARGEDGDWLKGQIRKHRKGKRRGSNVPSTDESGFRRSKPIAALQPPPWYRGARIR